MYFTHTVFHKLLLGLLSVYFSLADRFVVLCFGVIGTNGLGIGWRDGDRPTE